MSVRFVCAVAFATDCICGCSDYSSQREALEGSSHAAEDEAKPISFESDPVGQSTVAKADEPVQAMIRLNSNEFASGGFVQLFIDLRITPGWHVYAANSDSGPYAPTALELELPEGVEMARGWTYPETRTNVGSGILAQVYEGDVSFRADLKMLKAFPEKKQTIQCRIEYQACNQFRCLQVVTRELRISLIPSTPNAPEK